MRRRRRTRTPRRSPALATLAALESSLHEFGPGLAARKLALLARLERTTLPDAEAVLRLHEAASFLLAYPDSIAVHRAALRLLRRFEQRRDLTRHAHELVNSGVAGTAIEFRFFSRMARWLTARWPERLAIDWGELGDTALLEALLPLLAHPAEAPGMDEYDLGLRGWLHRLERPGEGDATFLIGATAALPASRALRDVLHDAIDAPITLAWGPDGPTRTAVIATPPVQARGGRARRGAPRIHVQRRPLVRARPDLAVEAHRPPVAIRALAPAEGERYVDLARTAMVTRERDLDAFSNADPRDVRLVSFEDGLTFACMGVRPADRLMLEAVYGFMTLKNGTPIGYVLTSALYRSCEIAYNVFDTFRGAEAALVYGRVVAMLRRLFDADAFTIYPYQLGEDNDEAIESGAWWFYYKLGFRPANRAIERVVARELALLARRPAHRSSPATLRRLASDNVYFHLGPPRDDVIGRLPLASVGLAVTDLLAARFGAARVAATPQLTREARAALGLRSLARWNRDELEALDRWAPLVLLLPGLARWSAEERRALAAVIRLKGGRRESAFVHAFDAHPRLRAAIALLARRTTA